MPVTNDQIVNGKAPKAKLRQEYEVLPDMVVTLKDPTMNLVEAFDQMGRTEEADERPPYKIALERVKLVVSDAEDIDWGEVLSTMVYKIHSDFFTLSLPISAEPGTS